MGAREYFRDSEHALAQRDWDKLAGTLELDASIITKDSSISVGQWIELLKALCRAFSGYGQNLRYIQEEEGVDKATFVESTTELAHDGLLELPGLPGRLEATSRTFQCTTGSMVLYNDRARVTSMAFLIRPDLSEIMWLLRS